MGIETFSTYSNNGLEQIMTSITGMFSSAQTAGITVVLAAISIGVVFVAGAFIWSIAKNWMKKSK